MGLSTRTVWIQHKPGDGILLSHTMFPCGQSSLGEREMGGIRGADDDL